MATLTIRKISDKVWKHTPSDGLAYIVSRLYIKSSGDKIRVVEFNGAIRSEHDYSDVIVYNVGGGAETFTSSQDVLERLEELGYIGFFNEGGGTPFNPSDYDLVDFNNLDADRFARLSDIPIQSINAGTNITIDNTDPKNPIINSSGVSTVKRKQYLYFSFAGTNLNNASNYWWGTDHYMGHFNETYSVNASFTPSNNFSAFNQFYGVNRPAFFDSYVKNIYMSFANVGATYTFDVAFLNYKLSNGYNSAVGNGVTDRVIIGRESNSVVGATGLKKFMDLSNINTTQLIQKGSCFRMFLNSGGSTNAGFGNPLFIVELEEV